MESKILSKNYKCNKLKGIAIALHGLSHAIKIGIVTTKHVPGKENIADLISKQRPCGDIVHLTYLLSKFLYVPENFEQGDRKLSNICIKNSSFSPNLVSFLDSETIFAGEFWPIDDGASLLKINHDYFI